MLHLISSTRNTPSFRSHKFKMDGSGSGLSNPDPDPDFQTRIRIGEKNRIHPDPKHCKKSTVCTVLIHYFLKVLLEATPFLIQ